MRRNKKKFVYARDMPSLMDFLKESVLKSGFKDLYDMLYYVGEKSTSPNKPVIYVSFTGNIKITPKRETELRRFLSRKAKLHLKRKSLNPASVELKKGETQQSLLPRAVLEKFQINLKNKSIYTEEDWSRLTTCENDNNRLRILITIFDAIIFTPEINQQLAIRSNNQLAKTINAKLLQFENFNKSLCKQFLEYDDTMRKIVNTLVNKMSEYTQVTYQNRTHTQHVFDFDAIIANIQKSSNDPIFIWSDITLLITLLEDYLEVAQELKNNFILLQKHLLLSQRVNENITEILKGINQEHREILLGGNRDTELINAILKAQKRVKSNLENMERSVAFFQNKLPAIIFHLSSVYQDSETIKKSEELQYAGARSEPIPIEYPSKPTENNHAQYTQTLFNTAFSEEPVNTSSTKESKAAAARLIAKQKKKEESRSSRTGQLTVFPNLKETNTNPTTSSNNQISLHLSRDSVELELTAHRLNNMNNVYISYDVPPWLTLTIDVKLRRFLATARRLKALQLNSLHQNGIKVYGLHMLIVKNIKHPGEHLLFLSHEFESKHIFVPEEIISHQKYEDLLNNKTLLEATNITARGKTRISQIINDADTTTPTMTKTSF